MKEDKNQLRIGVVLSYVNLGIGNLIPVFYTPIMLSLLSQSEYGLYNLAASFTSYLTLISMGLGSAITRYLIKAREEEGKEAEQGMLGLFTRIFQVISIAGFLVGIGLTASLGLFYGDSLTPDELLRMKILVFIIACNTSLGFLMTPQISVVTSHEKFIFLQSMNIVITCFGPILNLIVLFFGFASIGMAVSSLVLNMIVRVIYYIYMRKVLDLRADYKNKPKNVMKEIIGFSFWIFVANLVNTLYNATDTVMIGAVPALATVGVAVYHVGMVFNSIVFKSAQAISSILTPRVNKMVFDKCTDEELTSLAIKTGRLQGYIITLIVTGFIAFGQPFIQIYTSTNGGDYSDAYWVAILMMVPNLIPLVQSVCLSITIAKNMHRFRSLVYLGIAITNVAGTWILMHIMGIIGAALMTGIALLIGQGIVMNIYYWKIVKINIPRFWKETAIIYIIPAMMCAFTLIISNFINFYNITYLIIGIVIYTMVYCLLSWFVMMNDYEKDIFRAPIQRIISRKK